MADTSTMTSLARALSHQNLDSCDSSPRDPLVPGRRRALSFKSSLNRLDTDDSSVIESRVLVLNTGGTIGMKVDHDVLKPEANALVAMLKKLPILHDAAYAEKTSLYDYYNPEDTLVLPLSKEKRRIIYTIVEYNPLLDSSNMTTKDWAKIGRDIETDYENYDGFVVLHGTDTMAYTASALSFMCEHLGKPVILTGSQVPIYEMKNDGRGNLLGALMVAGQYCIPEVCLYFYNKLYRGNRVTKVDAGSYNAFSSPNLPPLATTEVDIAIDWDTVWMPNTTSKFRVSTELNRNVGLLRLFPGITTEAVRAFLQSAIEGVVLESYGSGNAPDNRPELIAELKKAIAAGTIIMNCTQCLKGTVSASYNTGKVLLDAGLIPGGDMTPEAALSKLSYVLAKTNLSIEGKKKLMSDNLRGEMSADRGAATLCMSDSRFIQIIAKTLSVNCTEEMKAICNALTPTLACAAAKTGDIEALDALKEMGNNLCLSDYDGRTPLHIAACEGYINVVQYLLSHGASVYARDRYGDTPLSNAVRFRRKEVVKLLRKTGAHFSRDELDEAGTELSSLAASGDMEGLEIWHLAGADLNKPSYDGRTASQVAEALGKNEVVKHLFKLETDKPKSGVMEFTATMSGK